jgi:hypothetical protein
MTSAFAWTRLNLGSKLSGSVAKLTGGSVTRLSDADINTDLNATPISRKHMDLLWLDPMHLQQCRQALQQGAQIGFPNGSAFADTAPVFRRMQEAFDRGQVSVADLDWAIAVDGIAADAEELGRRDPARAIGKYREALCSAPGCDLYLMSVGSCLAMVENPEQGVRYLERAAEINPVSERIASNLDNCQRYLRDKRGH